MENQEIKPKKTGWKGPLELANHTGRTPGSKNKQTAAIRKAYQNLVEMNLESMSRWIAEVAANDPKGAVELLIKLSEYVIPKLARTELTGKDGDDLFKNITFEFGTPINDRLIDAEEIEFEDDVI
jgi:hypothetical protein